MEKAKLDAIYIIYYQKLSQKKRLKRKIRIYSPNKIKN